MGDDGVVAALRTVDGQALAADDRLVAIKDAIVAIARSVEWRIRGAALEGYSMRSTNKPFDQGEVGGVVRLVLADNKIPRLVVAPALLKMFATGKPGATKDMMISAAKALGASPADDNQADAFFLARVAWASQVERGLARREADVVHALKNPPARRAPARPRRLVPAAI